MRYIDKLTPYWQQTSHFLRSRLARLSLSYLAIIMVMSLGFSLVLYHTSARELRRQLPPQVVMNGVNPTYDPYFTFNSYTPRQFFQQRIHEGQGDLLTKLVLMNLSVLIVGAAASYYLARRTLRPIEHAMEAQSRFASDASHELRTPLTVIQTENEVALRKPKLTLKEATAVIESNLEEVNKLKQLSEGLLRLAREDAADLVLESVDVQEAVTDAMNHVLKVAQAKHIMIYDTTPKLHVVADGQSLTQSLVVLLDNAIKYSERGGTVHIEAHRYAGEGIIKVRDEGPGISPDHLPHIFERFYRVDPSRSKQNSTGNGLGLALAQKLIEQQKGEISVQSKLGNGATFVIKLPSPDK